MPYYQKRTQKGTIILRTTHIVIEIVRAVVGAMVITAIVRVSKCKSNSVIYQDTAATNLENSKSCRAAFI